MSFQRAGHKSQEVIDQEVFTSFQNSNAVCAVLWVLELSIHSYGLISVLVSEIESNSALISSDLPTNSGSIVDVHRLVMD